MLRTFSNVCVNSFLQHKYIWYLLAGMPNTLFPFEYVFFNLHYDKKTNAIAKSLKTFINIDSSMIRWFSFANLSNFEID